ncbi:MAG: OmpH family outer membrane protein [Gammaproteobacteria bacterium]|nr:OmpH family outer membrane protein [Gammaproteobacteria bacterium]
MKFCKLVKFSLAAWLLLLPFPSYSVEIAYVDARRLIDEAPQGRDEVKKLEAEFSERGRELQARIDLFTTNEKELQKNAVTMSSEELEERTGELRDMQRSLQREQQIYNEDYARSRNQGLARLEQLISIVIIDVAKREKIDLVLQQAVYASRDIDLTGKVLEELDKRYRE